MILLAYDCSSRDLSAALFEDGKKLCELHPEAGERHSTVLVPTIEKLLKKAHLKLSDVDIFAVGVGPGSFTGLRVGIATAKVLGYVLRKRIVGISSLEAIAREAVDEKSGRVAVALDARRSKVYGAVYEHHKNKFKVIMKPALLDEKKFREISSKADLVLWGDNIPKATGIAKAAFSHIRQKKFIDPFDLQPLYLHPRDCNVTLQATHA